ncbi:MAG: TIGR02646 family protein [Methylococcales bacterium]|nr:TIGR02646 family protein [Methylococcales bacterium]
MKACLKGAAPDLLVQYQVENPTATWEQFKNECQEGYQALQDQLQLEQGNLCCYCEIDTKQGLGIGIDDFRVEHFHPKSAIDESNHNWALDWQNMLGCCHGGSERYVTDNKNRFVAEHAERHSDVLKANFIWDDEILNPLQIPVFPILFKANRKDGSLSVRDNNCRDAGISIEKVNNCLHFEKLNLNSDHLSSLRKATLDALNKQITMALSSGLTIEDAMVNLVKAQLRKDNKGHWPSFFTTIRSYLGEIAEEHLRSINYNG